MTATEAPRALRRALALAVPLLLASSTAFAQTTPANARAAQLLFDEAKHLADQKDFTRACPKFVQSHQLDPAGGTILHAADCHEQQGKLASAWAEYNEALSYAIKANRTDRESIARARIQALAPKIAKVRVEVPVASKELAGFSIWLNGTRVGGNGPLLDAPIPVDAGPHVIEARADGHLTATQKFTIADAEEQTISFDELSVDPAAEKRSARRPFAAASDSRGNSQRVAGIALMGAGGVGLVLGTIFGVHALSIGDQSDQCRLGPEANGCPANAVDDQERARTSGTISTLGFVAGGVLAAGGAVLYLTAPSHSARAQARPLRVGLGGRDLTLLVSGEF